MGHFDCVDWWRRLHQRPLAKVNANLRYYVRKVGVDEPIVTQRLKRYPTIIDKLRRHPTMQLSTMEDIGGVRAILPSIAAAHAVSGDLQRRWDVSRVRDYIAEPKADGYRAVHLIVRKDGCFIEVQLRTPRQDTWAQSVEQDTRRLRAGLKFGSGPDDLREYYRLISEMFAMVERDEELPEGFLEALANSYRSTRSYFRWSSATMTMSMSPAEIKNFLVTYDVECQEAHVEPFGEDYERAAEAYAEAERRHRDDPNIEVVLFGSDSEQTLERTHSSYFQLREKHIDQIVARELAELGLR